jgi:hypothetical protein
VEQEEGRAEYGWVMRWLRREAGLGGGGVNQSEV